MRLKVSSKVAGVIRPISINLIATSLDTFKIDSSGMQLCFLPADSKFFFVVIVVIIVGGVRKTPLLLEEGQFVTGTAEARSTEITDQAIPANSIPTYYQYLHPWKRTFLLFILKKLQIDPEITIKLF